MKLLSFLGKELQVSLNFIKEVLAVTTDLTYCDKYKNNHLALAIDFAVEKGITDAGQIEENLKEILYDYAIDLVQKEGYIELNVGFDDLIALEWELDESDYSENYGLAYRSGALMIFGTDIRDNESFVIAAGLDSMGGEEGLAQLIFR